MEPADNLFYTNFGNFSEMFLLHIYMFGKIRDRKIAGKIFFATPPRNFRYTKGVSLGNPRYRAIGPGNCCYRAGWPGNSCHVDRSKILPQARGAR